jgi:hypothetical protein
VKRSLVAPLALLLAAFSTAPLGADATARRVLVYLVALPGAGLTDGDMRVLYEGMIARFAASTPELAVAEPAAIGVAPLSANARSREAWAAGADAWVWVGITRSGDEYTAKAQVFDITAGGEVREFEGRGQQPELWAAVAASTGERLPRRQPRQADAVRTTQVQVRAAVGTRVTGLTDGEIVVGPDGEASLELQAFATYTLIAVHPEREPYSRSFYLKGEPLVVQCVQPRVKRWALEASLARLAYPSLAIGWFALPQRLLIGAGWTTFNVGVPLWGKESETDLALNQAGVSAVLYADRGGALRPYWGVDAFVRLSNEGGDLSAIELEPQAPFGFGVAAGAELGAGRIRPFIEYHPQVYILAHEDDIRAYYDILDAYGTSPPPYIIAGPLLIDLSSIRVGARLRF